eukprot:PhF_6_TR2326/c1_g1_i4/m.4143
MSSCVTWMAVFSYPLQGDNQTLSIMSHSITPHPNTFCAWQQTTMTSAPTYELIAGQPLRTLMRIFNPDDYLNPICGFVGIPSPAEVAEHFPPFRVHEANQALEFTFSHPPLIRGFIEKHLQKHKASGDPYIDMEVAVLRTLLEFFPKHRLSTESRFPEIFDTKLPLVRPFPIGNLEVFTEPETRFILWNQPR